jgi:hypothetical protein
LTKISIDVHRKQKIVGKFTRWIKRNSSREIVASPLEKDERVQAHTQSDESNCTLHYRRDYVAPEHFN